jgi:hypothetical protein
MMPLELNANQIDCLQHAHYCREPANDTTNAADKGSWLRLADRWEMLAETYDQNDGLRNSC